MIKPLAHFLHLTGAGETTPARHRSAIVLMILGAVGVSFGGLFVRHLEQADGMQFNAYRGLVGGIFLMLIVVVRYRRSCLAPFIAMKPNVWLGAVCLGFAAFAYVLSLERTTVANTHFVLSTTPFLSAALAWLFLRERIALTTWVAMAVALTGVGLMVREGLELRNITGDLLALVTVSFFATFSVIMRNNRMSDMLPAVIIGSFVTMGAGMVGCGGDLYITSHDLWLTIVWGVIIAVCGDWIFVISVRHLAAAETTLLLMMIPSILGPAWVWWLLGEVPTSTTLLGGALVLAAVLGWGLRELKSSG